MRAAEWPLSWVPVLSHLCVTTRVSAAVPVSPRKDSASCPECSFRLQSHGLARCSQLLQGGGQSEPVKPRVRCGAGGAWRILGGGVKLEGRLEREFHTWQEQVGAYKDSGPKGGRWARTRVRRVPLFLSGRQVGRELRTTSAGHAGRFGPQGSELWRF